MPLNQRVDKENVAHLHYGEKKMTILKFACKWMELEKNPEVIYTQKDEHGMYSLISEH